MFVSWGGGGSNIHKTFTNAILKMDVRGPNQRNFDLRRFGLKLTPPLSTNDRGEPAVSYR